jgi:hypothetical protein
MAEPFSQLLGVAESDATPALMIIVTTAFISLAKWSMT